MVPPPSKPEEIARILVVEDNADHALLVTEALRTHADWGVEVCSTIEQAFSRLQSESYQVVLVDFCLPDGNGLDLIEWARDRSSVVVMTSQGSERVAVDALQRGAYEYVVKDSVFQDILPDVIQRSIDRYYADTKTKLLLKNLKEDNLRLTAANSKLVDIDRIRSDCLSHVSQALRNPLGEIRECVEQMGQGRINQRLKAYLVSSRAECDRLDRVISNMLEMSMNEAGGLRLRRRRLEIGTLLDDCARQLLDSFSSQGQKLQYDLPENLSAILADKQQLTQALQRIIKLVQNSSPRPGIVGFRIGREETMATIDIYAADTEPADRNLISAEEDTETIRKDRESSLAVASSVIMLHGGSVKSGKGSTGYNSYSLFLPVYDPGVEKQVFLADRRRYASVRGEKLTLSMLRLGGNPNRSSLPPTFDWTVLEDKIRSARPGILRGEIDDMLSHIPENTLMILTNGDEQSGHRILERIIRFIDKDLRLQLPMELTVVTENEDWETGEWLKAAATGFIPVENHPVESGLGRQ